MVQCEGVARESASLPELGRTIQKDSMNSSNGIDGSGSAIALSVTDELSDRYRHLLIALATTWRRQQSLSPVHRKTLHLYDQSRRIECLGAPVERTAPTAGRPPT